MIRLISL